MAVGGDENIMMISILFHLCISKGMNILMILSLLSMWAEKLEEARPRLLELDSMTYSKPVPALIHYDHDNDDDENFN